MRTPREVARAAESRLRRLLERLSSDVQTLLTDLRVRLSRFRTLQVPGDRPPLGHAAYYDYRDVLEVEQVPAGYRVGAFGLGDAFDLRLGHRGRVALPADVMRRHTAIVGPRRHETRSLLLAPWIAMALELEWSVLAIDSDGDLDEVVDIEIVESDVGRSGTRRRIDRTSPARSQTWSWLADLDEPSIDAAVRALVGLDDDGALTGPGEDAKILRGLLELVRDRTISPRGTALTSTLASHGRFRSALARDRHSVGAARLHELAEMSTPWFRARGAGALARLRRIERRLAPLFGRPAIDIDELLATPQLLTLTTRPRDGAGGRSLASLLTAVLAERAFRRPAGGTRQLLIVVEDARTLLAGLDLAELLEIGSATGVAFVLCTPTTGAYGLQVAEVLDRCGTLIATAGCSPQSARFMSDRIARRGLKLGDREISRPPFPGRIATVDSDLVADRPFLVDISA